MKSCKLISREIRDIIRYEGIFKKLSITDIAYINSQFS